MEDDQQQIAMLMQKIQAFYSWNPDKRALRVRDFLVNPPQDAHKALKTRLLQAFNSPQKERASRIMDYPALGDRKATKMADELMNFLEEDGADL